MPGLIGGGAIPRPGEVSLAHNGVLFLDELPEFRKNVLEVLRQPLEDGEVTISRAQLAVTFPARFMLVAAMNPCPCGYRGDPKHQCSCTRQSIQRYWSKISGPLLDRIDIHIEVPSIEWRDLTAVIDGESSETIRQRVNRARKIQLDRLGTRGFIFQRSDALRAPQEALPPGQRFHEIPRKGCGKAWFVGSGVSSNSEDFQNHSGSRRGSGHSIAARCRSHPI